MATTVNDVLTDVKHGMKITTTNTDRDTELIAYMNRVYRGAIVPLLIRHQSDLAMKEWNTTETVENVRRVALPTDIVSFHSLYVIDIDLIGTADAGTAAGYALTLPETATTGTTSSSDDAYNTMNFRATGGTGDAQQFVISDYAGSTRVCTTSTAIGTGLSTDTTFVIFREPFETDRIVQKDFIFVKNNYPGTGEPQVYAMDTKDYIILGPIPNEVYALQGWYYAWPTKLADSSTAMPYDELFDDLFVQYTLMMAQNTDEYGFAQFDATMMNRIQEDVFTIIKNRGNKGINQVPILGTDLNYPSEVV